MVGWVPTAGKKYPENPMWGLVVNKITGGTEHILTSIGLNLENLGKDTFIYTSVDINS